MRTKVLLRIAAALVAIHLLGHTAGHLGWDNPEDAQLKQVVSSMKSYEAPFMGATRSMADYYNGYSLIMFGLYAMTIMIVWFAADFIQQQHRIARQVLIPIGIVYVFFGIVEYVSFFPFAAAMSFFAGVLILVATRKG